MKILLGNTHKLKMGKWTHFTGGLLKAHSKGSSCCWIWCASPARYKSMLSSCRWVELVHRPIILRQMLASTNRCRSFSQQWRIVRVIIPYASLLQSHFLNNQSTILLHQTAFPWIVFDGRCFPEIQDLKNFCLDRAIIFEFSMDDCRKLMVTKTLDLFFLAAVQPV